MTTQQMNLRLPTKVTALIVGASTFLLGFLFLIVFADSASAHGYIESPASRAYMCKQGDNTACGAIQYEPQSIEAIGNFPTTGPADGEITGGGIFKELFEQKADRWNKVTLQTGLNTITWKLTAAHATDNWKYYITKADWDPNQPIGRDDLELISSFDDKGAKPNFTTSHQINIPADRTGYHLILGVWDIADTPNAFYQVIDANIVSSGAVQGPDVPANVSAASKTATSVTLTWTASTGAASYEIHRNGALVGTATTNSYVDQGLTANTSYIYTVRAVDAAGAKSQASPAVTVITTAEGNSGGSTAYPEWASTKVYLGGAKVQYNGAVYEAKWWTQNETPGKALVWKLISDADQGTTGPIAPTGVHSMKTTSTSVSLMWTASEGAAQYEIYLNNFLLGKSTQAEYEATGLTAGTSYVFTVVAVDGAGVKSQASSPFTVKTATEGGAGGNEGSVYPEWDAQKAYVGGDKVYYDGAAYEAKWWTYNELPNKADVWKQIK